MDRFCKRSSEGWICIHSPIHSHSFVAMDNVFPRCPARVLGDQCRAVALAVPPGMPLPPPPPLHARRGREKRRGRGRAGGGGDIYLSPHLLQSACPCFEPLNPVRVESLAGSEEPGWWLSPATSLCRRSFLHPGHPVLDSSYEGRARSQQRSQR